jgi:teichuronic acid biosynthesis glycosyltransferase TuaC
MGEALEDMGVRASRIHLVPNGIDRSVFGQNRDRGETRRALGLDESNPVILYVARIEPQKGFAELLDAFERIHRERPNVTLAIIGDGVWRDRADAARERFGGRLLVLGAKTLADIALWMTACDVLTLPSHNEGTPNVLLEALASGRPAVATRVGGVPDVLADPRTGILVAPRDAAALADGLLAALDRTWNADEIRACGPVSWEDSAASLGGVLKSIA